MGLAADIALILVAALAGGLLAHRLGQPPLIGYIVAGVLVGPHAIGPSVIEVHDVELLAEIGVALLLFGLGLEVSFRDLRPVRKVALIGGTLQIVLTIAFGWGVGRLMLGLDHRPAIWLGALLSLSSTMVVLKTLVSQGVLGTLASRVMIGILIVQDLAVVPMLIVLPKLGEAGGGLPDVGKAAVRAAIFLAVMIVVGTKLMPALLRTVARWKSRELFLVAVVALGIGVGYGTYLFGLSFAFGAFVAGMVLSESEFSHQALGEIVPLRDVFGLVFFVSAGMLLDPGYLVENLGRVAALVVVVMAGKGLVLGGIARAFGYGNRAPLIVALGLSQVGEFSFVLARVGLRDGSLSRDLYGLALTTAIVSMALTPLLQRTVPPLYRLHRKFFPQREPLRTFDLPKEGLRDHVVVVGYGRTGRAAVEVMRRTGLPFVVVDSDHAVTESCAGGCGSAIWGDATVPTVLEATGLASARLLLITTPDVAGIRAIVRHARAIRPGIPIVARAPSPEHLEELRGLGVYEIVQPEFEAGLEMVRQVLARFDYSPADILRYSDAVHRESYGPFLGRPEPREAVRALDELRHAARGIEFEWIPLREGSAIAGKTLAEAEFRARSGASVVAVRTAGATRANPSPDHRLRPGDLLAVLGTDEQRAEARRLVEGSGPVS